MHKDPITDLARCIQCPFGGDTLFLGSFGGGYKGKCLLWSSVIRPKFVEPPNFYCPREEHWLNASACWSRCRKTIRKICKATIIINEKELLCSKYWEDTIKEINKQAPEILKQYQESEEKVDDSVINTAIKDRDERLARFEGDDKSSAEKEVIRQTRDHSDVSKPAIKRQKREDTVSGDIGKAKPSVEPKRRRGRPPKNPQRKSEKREENRKVEERNEGESEERKPRRGRPPKKSKSGGCDNVNLPEVKRKRGRPKKVS
jgi:hypothetical protein